MTHRVVDIAEELRTRLHCTVAHPAGPLGTMPVVCSVCGLVDVVMPDDFSGHEAQFRAAKSRCVDHVLMWRKRQRNG